MLVSQIFLILSGIFMLIVIVLLSVDTYLRRTRNCRTTARVLCNRVLRRNSRSRMYYPVLGYYANGQDYTEESCVGTNPPRFKEGQTITIYYNTDKPYKLRIPGHLLQIIAICLFVLALATFAFYIFI